MRLPADSMLHVQVRVRAATLKHLIHLPACQPAVRQSVSPAGLGALWLMYRVRGVAAFDCRTVRS